MVDIMAYEKTTRVFTTLTLVFAIYVLSSKCGEAAARSSNLGSSTHSSDRSADNSRFKGLDKVLNRLDGASPDTTKLEQPSNLMDRGSRNQGAKPTVIPPSFSRDAKEFDNLDDDLDDDESYEDEDETTGNNDVLSDKMSHSSNWGYQFRNRYLASKTTTSTTTTTTTTTTPPPQMSFSQFKWHNYGTRQAVEQSRRQSLQSNTGSTNNNQNGNYYGNSNGASYHQHRHHGQSHNGQHHHHHHQNNNNQQYGYNRAQPQTPGTAIQEAVNHALKVSKEGACKIPRPKVVRVQDYYPHPSKTYLPHCTILYQCAEDTGCCKNDLSCSPKTSHRVELAFYTMTVDSNRGSTVERLVFYNHTECECRDKLDEMMPRDVSYSEPLSSSSRSFLYNNVDPSATTSNQHLNYQGKPYENSRTKNLLRCKCPSSFTERTLHDGSCSCDCFDKQIDCLRQKRGRDFFSMQDKWCIQSGRCEIPGCTYGSYIHLAGRCPRKKEKQSLSWHKYLTE